MMAVIRLAIVCGRGLSMTVVIDSGRLVTRLQLPFRSERLVTDINIGDKLPANNRYYMINYCTAGQLSYYIYILFADKLPDFVIARQ
jgi:hypothetical protein